MTMFEFYEVGGAVRDALLGVNSKDIDYSAVYVGQEMLDPARQDEVMSWTFERLADQLRQEGFNIFQSRPEYLTIRAQFPLDHPARALHPETKNLTADFVLARKEGPYSDGRRPDWVKPGTLEDDLARRDFTVNAIARGVDGVLIDPYDGALDLEVKNLRCVGNAEDRIREDALRALRAVRFMVTKGFHGHIDLLDVLMSDWLPELLSSVSAERKRDELDKCFKHDTLRTLELLWSFKPAFMAAVFTDGLRLKPSMEQ